MEKYSIYRGTSGGGAPHVHLIEPGGYGLGDTGSLEKTASKQHLPEVAELVESIQPQSDRLYLLNSALGAGEHVGFNLRGDWFGERGLLHTPKDWDKIAVWDIDARRQAANDTESVDGWGKLAWGFPTFYNAHRFRHHVNKDPNKAYGFILGAFWDPRMHRVILVSELIKDMCAQMGASHIYDRIARGDFPDTSMGAKVPFDVCSICGHVAKNPGQYCEHVAKNAEPPYGMKALLPDGRRCGVYNPYPRFFDDSFVFVGAERSAKTMTNLTEQVKGENPYSQKVYMFRSAPLSKAAGVIDSGSTELEQSRAAVQDALKRTREDRVAAAKTKESGGRLSRLLDTVQPATTEEEKVLLKAVSRPLPTKSASLKWAEILKRIPIPTEGQKVVLEHHGRRTPPLSKEQLQLLSQNPSQGLSKAAELGFVLTPAEFQYVMLSGMVPKTAEALWDAHQVFPSEDLDVEDAPAFRCVVVSEEYGTAVKEALAPLFWERSFAPSAVSYRTSRVMPEHDKAASAVDYPGAGVISQLYNNYRGGLLAAEPDWRYVSVGRHAVSDLKTEGKTAEFAQDFSRVLLRLAHWPALPIG